MPAEPQTTLPPCVWCSASRAEQAAGRSYYTSDGDPLCAVCWEAEYGDEYRASNGGDPAIAGWTPEERSVLRRIALAGDIQSAADLLRRNGWTVTPPQEAAP